MYRCVFPLLIGLGGRGGAGYLEGHWMSPGSNLIACAPWKLLMVKSNILVAPSIFCVMYLLMMIINWGHWKKCHAKWNGYRKSGASWCCDNILSVDLSGAVLWNLVHALLVNVQTTLLAAETLRWRLADKMVSQKSSSQNDQDIWEAKTLGHIGPSWATATCFVILGHFCRLGGLLQPFYPFLASLGHFGSKGTFMILRAFSSF